MYLDNEKTLIDLSESLSVPAGRKRRDRRVVGPYRFTPGRAEAAAPIFFYHASDSMLTGDGCVTLRLQWADDVTGAGINHTGWYTDEYGDGDHIRGVIARLTTGRNRGFLAGWSMGRGMCGELEREIYEHDFEAASVADQLAHLQADRERQHDVQERARIEAEERAAEDAARDAMTGIAQTVDLLDVYDKLAVYFNDQFDKVTKKDPESLMLWLHERGYTADQFTMNPLEKT